jgi:hypothetical protein
VSLNNPRLNNLFGLFLFVLLVAIPACATKRPPNSDFAATPVVISCEVALAANQAGAQVLMRELEAGDSIMKQMKLFVCCEANDCSKRASWFPIWAGESQTADDLNCQGSIIEISEFF